LSATDGGQDLTQKSKDSVVEGWPQEGSTDTADLHRFDEGTSTVAVRSAAPTRGTHEWVPAENAATRDIVTGDMIMIKESI
jgi:hypothetical protein